MSTASEVTELLRAWASGDRQALDQLTPLVYGELRQLAASHLRRERADHTFQPTALVHEAYLRLVDQPNSSWQDRSHFYGVAGRLMRQILVSYARRRLAGKRAHREVSLDETVGFAPDRSADLIVLDDALHALEKLDVRKCKAVELRYFAGLSMEETARALDVSSVTVRRDLRMAETWLYHEIRKEQHC
jgi:RNA polymerase sigma factor (TIGR02999 family)